MRVHVIKHVPFEGPGLIAQWADSRDLARTESLAVSEEHRALQAGDLLAVMGGPMAADDEVASPWLTAEKTAIAAALDSGVLVVGVCLGAQLLAEVIGGRVRRNREREIGWYAVRRTAAAAEDAIFSAFPDGLVVGHWHSDTFDLPAGVASSLSSDATANQAFSALGGRAVGLQFHIEWTREGLADLAARCADETEAAGRFVATGDAMLARADSHIPACREALFGVLDRMVATGIGA